MKKLILAALLVPAVLCAEPVEVNKRIMCDKAALVFDSFVKEYGEKPIWVGASKNGNTTVLSNQKTGTWSVILFNNQVACVIEVGDHNQVLPEAAARGQHRD